KVIPRLLDLFFIFSSNTPQLSFFPDVFNSIWKSWFVGSLPRKRTAKLELFFAERYKIHFPCSLSSNFGLQNFPTNSFVELRLTPNRPKNCTRRTSMMLSVWSRET